MRRSLGSMRAPLAVTVLLFVAVPSSHASDETVVPPDAPRSSELEPFDRPHGPATDPAESINDATRNAYGAAILRPLQFVQLIVGGVFWLPSYPLAVPFGWQDEVTELCVKQPYEGVFRRPLGEL